MTDRLDQLADAAARYATAEEDLPKRKDALSASIRKVDLILTTLGRSEDVDPKTLLIPAATIGTLRDLISEKSGIDVARQSAEKEHDAERQDLQREQRAWQALNDQGATIDVRMIAQLQSELSRLRNGNLVAELRIAERDVPGKRLDFDDAVGGLHPWTGDGDALLHLKLPSAERVEAWKLTLSGLEKRHSQLRERERELFTKRDEDIARIAALRKAVNIVDDERAAAALLDRDEAWIQHLSALNRETADRFENKMRKTDEVAAARLNTAKELEELRSLSAGLSVTVASVERHRQMLREADEELEILRREIQSEVPTEIQLSDAAQVGTWLERISRWTEKRASTLVAWDELRRTQIEIENAKAGIASERDSLTKTLIAAGIKVDGLDLAALMQLADNVLADHAALQTKRTESGKSIGELEAAVTQRKAALDQAIAAFDAWQRDWTIVLAATWFADRQGRIGAVRELLDVITNLPQAVREKDDLQHRVHAMVSDQKSFSDAVAQLYEDIGDKLDDSNSLAAAKALLRLHENAKQVETKRQELERALVDHAIEYERLEGKIATHAARKKEMTFFFKVDALDEVRLALERCRKRNDLVEQQGTIERQIISDIQMQSLEEALTSLAAADVADLQREQAELATRLEDLDGRAKNLFADKARATDRLTAIGSDDAVARLDANKRTLLLEIEDLALRYLRLRSGSLVAEHGIRAYRDKHRSAMMNRASEAFRLITRGEYSGLATRPDKEREVLIGLARNGSSKVAAELSRGTQFQLYLALRLAGYEEFATARPSVPFIADDIMETFDEPRSEEVFRLFGQMAQVGQVIYLTHHRHLCDIAAEAVPVAKIHEII